MPSFGALSRLRPKAWLACLALALMRLGLACHALATLTAAVPRGLASRALAWPLCGPVLACRARGWVPRAERGRDAARGHLEASTTIAPGRSRTTRPAAGWSVGTAARIVRAAAGWSVGTAARNGGTSRAGGRGEIRHTAGPAGGACMGAQVAGEHGSGDGQARSIVPFRIIRQANIRESDGRSAQDPRIPPLDIPLVRGRTSRARACVCACARACAPACARERGRAREGTRSLALVTRSRPGR
jgi:hypothetical protein